MRNRLINLFGIFTWLFTLVITLQFIVTSNISFWYDPARDMLAAWANFSKITLIGPPSGIPGFFYGPYWIWWLSFGQVFSKDPAIVTFITMAIPYLIIFAGVLYLFSRIFGKVTSILLWILFFLTTQSYMTQLWNPYLAPIFYLVVIYLFTFYAKNLGKVSSLFPVFVGGVLTGIALNIHISFSVGFTLGCIFFIILSHIFSKQKLSTKLQEILAMLGSFLAGIVITFIPFFLFEVRHGFHQTQIAVNAFLHGGDVVLQKGFTKLEIFDEFIHRFGELLGIPTPIAVGIGIGAVIVFLYFLWKKRLILLKEEKQLILLLVCISSGVLGVYFVAKNPIWDYHFDGTEVIWLLVIGIGVSRIKKLQILLFIWVIILSFMFSSQVISSLKADPLTRGSLYTKEYIVRTIQNDAENKNYTVYTYSQSIYTYEYNYLFRWITGKEFSYDPGKIQRKGEVYLILPPSPQSYLTDFIHFHTPDNLYMTAKTWHIPDGTVILKRVPINY